jgi:hypothetical protein
MIPMPNKIEEIRIEDVKYITALMRMPAIIVLDQYCDVASKDEITDIMYIRKQPYKEVLKCKQNKCFW